MKRIRFLSRVREALPSLGPAESRLGVFISEFPGELASYNASELAALAGVSNATVTRFVRRLGYASYEAARVDVREESGSGSRLYAPRQLQVVRDPGQYSDADTRNIQLTLGGIDPAQIDGLAARLISARKVWTIGFRASGSFASYMQWQLTQVIENIVAVPAAGQTMGEHLASFQADDVAIFFAMRRRVAQTDALLDEIHALGTPIALVTDEGAPSDPRAAWHFRCETASPGPLFSHSSVMALCGVIANRTIEKADRTGRSRLAEIERLNDRLSEL